MTSRFGSLGKSSFCRARLDFVSVLKFTCLMGICMGTSSVPILLIVQSETWLSNPLHAVFLIVGAPLSGVLNGLLTGALGYLPYSWVTRRVNIHTYHGEFDLLEKHVEET